jgi:hypothetical protein
MPPRSFEYPDAVSRIVPGRFWAVKGKEALSQAAYLTGGPSALSPASVRCFVKLWVRCLAVVCPCGMGLARQRVIE